MLTAAFPQLVSSKQLTCFSDFRAGDDEPDFLAAKRYREYLTEYCSKFQLWPHINLNTKVTHITRKVPGKDGARHVITYCPKSTGKEEQWECDAIAICAGLHVTPNIPEIPGIENVPTVIHSSQFKSREQFGENKTIMVMGGGETASDVAFLAVTGNTKQVLMCHRYGFHFAPKVSSFTCHLSCQLILSDLASHSAISIRFCFPSSAASPRRVSPSLSTMLEPVSSTLPTSIPCCATRTPCGRFTIATSDSSCG